MKYDNLLRYAIQIIERYSGEEPLHLWLKDFYKKNHQMGSRDRKQVRDMVYCFYRIGHALPPDDIPARIFTGLFLGGGVSHEILRYFKQDWDENIHLPLEEKIAICQQSFPSFGIARIFPWKDALSEEVDHLAFCRSFLVQPDLFIRIRPGHEQKVRHALLQAAVPFREISDSSLAFHPSTKLEEQIVFNREAVVQDLSSQRTGLFFTREGFAVDDAWDCCAGSGGKSILLQDLYPVVNLTVSDIRKTILQQLRLRFTEAGITQYAAFTADLSTNNSLPAGKFDLILADVPCTGSGTWSRTPESLYYFKPDMDLPDYPNLQKKILQQVSSCLKQHGMLVYITCSVFKGENEAVVQYIAEQGSLRLLSQQLIRGYHEKADSMFVAVFSPG